MDSPEQPFTVFVVDDDPTARMVAATALEESSFVVREFPDAAVLLDVLEDSGTTSPDLLLLDIEMPGMNGIEACRALRAAGHDSIQVMYVSAHNDLETRLAAYDAGGNDFIVKPFEPEELARKAGVARECTRRRRELGADAQFARQTAFTAMSSMGEMGCVLEFLRTSFACDTPASLAATLFDTLRQFGLDGLVSLDGASGRQCFSSRGECTPLEYGILEHAATMERIFQFRNRMTINYPGVTLLVHPLPIDDPDRTGRLRDHLAILAEGAEARLQAMNSLHRQAVQASGIGEAIVELTATLGAIDRLQAEHRLRAAEIDELYLEELVGAFVHLGLSDDQERTLADMAQRTHMKLAALRDESSDVGDHLLEVTRRLERLVRE